MGNTTCRKEAGRRKSDEVLGKEKFSVYGVEFSVHPLK